MVQVPQQNGVVEIVADDLDIPPFTAKKSKHPNVAVRTVEDRLSRERQRLSGAETSARYAASDAEKALQQVQQIRGEIRELEVARSVLIEAWDGSEPDVDGDV